ncbi:adrenocortical dysplasia protein homolog isoform X1 [Apteryx mantelli]|uniref:Adrenocortical dysplasia protein homolog isoform X1 n=2 Tax=Apteryx mantelli TaxID=2696672 RepID=A0ABM4F1S2_9AVES
MAAPGVEEQGGQEWLDATSAARQAPEPRFVYENKNMSSSKVYVLQPWIANLLVNYDQLDTNENLLAGQVLRVLSDPSTPGQAGVLRDAVLQVSDGSYYIRVVITSEALQAEENSHMQLRLSSLICRIIVLQKYTVCFREEARLEDCEFFLTAQQFIVLPMERQRLESSDGNQEPSVLRKIKELWLRSLSLKSDPSSEPSISQLIDVIGQNQLEVLKQNAEECLDLQMPKELPAAEKVELFVTQWEAERKKEPSEDVFMVPASILVIPPEEEAVCNASKADVCEMTPGKSSDDRMVPGDQSAVSQISPVESTALSQSSEASLENPWDRLPSMSLTLTSSEEKSLRQDSPRAPEAQLNMAADSNTPDLLEPSSQDSPESLLQDAPVETSSPSLLHSYGSTSSVEAGTSLATSAAEAACRAPSAAQDPQVLGCSQANQLSLSPTFPVLPSSRLASLTEGAPHREQADSSGTAFPPDVTNVGLAHARTQGGEAPCGSRKSVGAKRKLLVGDSQALPDLRRSLRGLQHKQHCSGVPQGSERDTSRKLEFLSTQEAKKSRREETRLQHGEEPPEEEDEQASSASGLDSRLEQRGALQPYVKERPVQYIYEAPSPELCERIRSVRISKAMLKWACWILTDREVES